MTETVLLQSIRQALGRRPEVRLWRNNSGALKDANGRWVHFGIASPGGSDLIGFVVVNGIAVFLAIEVKTETGTIKTEQQDFISFVRQYGGRAGIARSIVDAENIINGKYND